MAALQTTDAAPRSRLSRVLWYRQLDHYPDTGPRVLFLGIVVLATILLYYELYVGGAVAPSIMSHYGMSFRYYVLITVAANAVGAFSSLIAGLADRWGRANLVAYGLGITALLVLVGIPNAHAKVAFALIIIAVGFVEGIILVATPALVRDFSPQMGRASAMGFWTLGPVVGSLMVSEVSSHTLSHLHAWQDQFIICGAIGLAVFVVALFGLRELSPRLRDQLMVSKRDRALIEAKANGVDIEASLRHPWRQMLHLDIVGFGVRHRGLLDLLLHRCRVLHHLLHVDLPLQPVAGQRNRELVLGRRRHHAGGRRALVRQAQGAKAVHGVSVASAPS